jgi:HAD superfamily hydrolase (TIGR01509 family)
MTGGPPGAATPVAIDAVVFDVGHVLVATDYDPWLRLLAAHGAPFESMDAFCEAVDLDAHEAGAVDGEAFLRRVERLLRRPVGRGQLVREWNAMYSPVLPLLAAARRLKASRRVYLLSNMGEVHWAHLERLLDVAGGTHGALPSYRVGRLKPTPEIYAAAEAAFRLEPSRTVFVDDRADNVAAARARGWHAVQHVAVEPTLHALARLGLPVHDNAAGA